MKRERYQVIFRSEHPTQTYISPPMTPRAARLLFGFAGLLIWIFEWLGRVPAGTHLLHRDIVVDGDANGPVGRTGPF